MSVRENLHKRIFEISYKHKLCHIGSCITSVAIIYDILKNKKENDLFVLSSGHAGLAYYVVLEDLYGINAENLLIKHGCHPNRDLSDGIQVSTGSLGLGLPIAIGMALSDRARQIHCLISDGECAEGSIWESLRFIKEHDLSNIKVYVNMNGFSAYGSLNTEYLKKLLKTFLPDIEVIETSFGYPFLTGLNAHYHILTKNEYESL